MGPVRVGNAAVVGGETAGALVRWPLTVAVWNANVGGGAIRVLWDHLVGGHGPAACPTVLLLQEVFATGSAIPLVTPAAAWAKRITGVPANEDRTDIVSFAREAGLSLVYVPSMRNGGRGGGPQANRATSSPEGANPPEDRGNAILANVPLSAPHAIELPFERQRRVAVVADLVIAQTTMTVCSVHLDNRSPWGRVWRTLGAARRRQMAGLLNVFANDTHGHAHVLGGDLNTWVGGRREGAYRLARARFPLPALPDPKPTHHFEIGGWPRHSDHLMFRLPPGWHGEYHRLDDTFGSDHYPLVGNVSPNINCNLSVSANPRSESDARE